jgi:hypothetical protein
MTKKEFEKEYIKNSQITRKFYKKNFVTLPCCCGEDRCHGWACVNKDKLSIKTHEDLYMR